MHMIPGSDGGAGHADDFAVFPNPIARSDVPAGDLVAKGNVLPDQ